MTHEKGCGINIIFVHVQLVVSMEFNNCLRHSVSVSFNAESFHFNTKAIGLIILVSTVTALHSLLFTLLLRSHTLRF